MQKTLQRLVGQWGRGLYRADLSCTKVGANVPGVPTEVPTLFNLLAEFQRATGMAGYRQSASLRVQVFLCGAILGRAGHRKVPHLSAAWGGLEKRNSLFDRILLYEVPTSRKLEIPTQLAG